MEWEMPMGLEDHLPAGFLLTTVEKWAQYTRSRSMWTATFGLAWCAIEAESGSTPPPGPTPSTCAYRERRKAARFSDLSERDPG